MTGMRSRLITILSVATLFAVLPVAASASTSVGATPPPGSTTAADCNADSGHVTRTSTGVTNPYIATVSGVVTEWQFQATTNPGTLVFQILNGDPAMNTTFTPVVESTPEVAAADTLNKFATRLPITAGQFVGLRTITTSHGCYYLGSTGFTDFGSTAPPAPTPASGPSSYGNASGTAATNIAATIEPDADGDGYGDETQDGCVTSKLRQDDCVKPSVKIDSAPAAKTKSRSAKFSFSSDDADATFECRVDSASFAACTSPLALKKLSRTKHAFEVRATDANKNTSAPETYNWKVKKKHHKHKH
jgi:hypothetical protein